MSAPEVLLGGLTGLHAATWGAYKDSPFEGFRLRSFRRSVVLGLVLGLVVAASGTDWPLLVTVGLLYTGERLATEWWKALLREDPQSSAYAIPMRLAVGGRPIDARLPRYATGIAVGAVLVLLASTVHSLQPEDPPAWLTVLVAGAGGWLTALGGAWKDAPIEGFSVWKFLRSPVVATCWALLLLPLVTDWLLLAVAAGGLSVLVIETYKTFLTGGRPPGKFAERPARFVEHSVRTVCRDLHCLVYGALAAVVLGSPAVVVPVAAAVAVAMLSTERVRGVLPRTIAQEPGADAELRRETA